MKDILTDIVEHTHSLGFINLLKVSTNETETTIESLSDDKSVVLFGNTKSPVSEFSGVFGMSNLDKLNLHLKNPEYQENAIIDVINDTRNNEVVPVHIHFSNELGDFENTYRFMNKVIIEEKMKSVRFKGAKWNVTFEPAISAVSRLRLQRAAHSEETLFNVKTVNNNLIFSFGDASSHEGSFVFHNNVSGTLSHVCSWPINNVLSILNLNGDITMSISDQGAMQISVDSGLAVYNYILPSQTK